MIKKPSSSERICIILPMWNEAQVIGEVVSATVARLKKSSYQGEVVVVDDGSWDNSAAIAQKNGATVIKHILNSGQGAAIATGLLYAKQNNFDIAVTMDSDGQHAIDDVMVGIKNLIERGDDLIIGSRLIDSRGMSRVKIFGNKGLSFITYLLFGIKTTDSQSGLRIFSKKSINNLKWTATRYEFCSEMLWRAKQLNLSVSEYPIKAIYTDYSTSTARSAGQNNWNAFNIVKNLLQHRIMELFQ